MSLRKRKVSQASIFQELLKAASVSPCFEVISPHLEEHKVDLYHASNAFKLIHSDRFNFAPIELKYLDLKRDFRVSCQSCFLMQGNKDYFHVWFICWWIYNGLFSQLKCHRLGKVVRAHGSKASPQPKGTQQILSFEKLKWANIDHFLLKNGLD